MADESHAFTPVIVPGWRNSGAGHWQTLWADTLPGALRVEQADWDWPRRDAWVDRIVQTIRRAPGPVVLAAHSLGCIAVAHLPADVLAWGSDFVRVPGAGHINVASGYGHWPLGLALLQSLAPVLAPAGE